jgi:hypothetical protein
MTIVGATTFSSVSPPPEAAETALGRIAAIKARHLSDYAVGRNLPQRIEQGVLVLGDFMSAGYFATTVLKVSRVAQFFGIIAGAVNISYGVISLLRGIEMVRNQRQLTLESARYIADGLFSPAIGAIMIVSSLSSVFPQLAPFDRAVSSPLASAGLFFAGNAFLVAEVGKSYVEQLKGRDFASRLQLSVVRAHCVEGAWGKVRAHFEEIDWTHPTVGRLKMRAVLCQNGANQIDCERASDLAEYAVQEMGVEATVEWLQLMRLIESPSGENRQKEILDQLTRVENSVAQWRLSLTLRAVQQCLTVGAFVAGLGAASSGSASRGAAALSQTCLALENALPVYFNLATPHRGNCKPSIPRADPVDLDLSRTFGTSTEVNLAPVPLSATG